MRQKDLIKRAVTLIKQIEKNKRLYRELDEITLILSKQKFRSDTLIMRDNFKDKNTQFKTTFVRRFELALD